MNDLQAALKSAPASRLREGLLSEAAILMQNEIYVSRANTVWRQAQADGALHAAGFVQCLLTPKQLRVDFMSINEEQPIFRTHVNV